MFNLKPSWIQREGQPDEHFAVSEGVRDLALLTGVNHVSFQTMEELIVSKRKALSR